MKIGLRATGPSIDDAETRVATSDLPMLLARIHRESSVDEQLEIRVVQGAVGSSHETRCMPEIGVLMEGGGFSVDHRDRTSTEEDSDTHVFVVTRQRSLPDYVAARMRVLICGLNPSFHSADLRVGFGRSGNRFWPAALASGLVTVDRDPVDALRRHRVGMTDMVKRASTRADSLTTEEYRRGLDRLENLCSWLRPSLVCMVGLAGWRSAHDRKAVAGLQQRQLGGSPVYVMPSTSGLNAHSSLDGLTIHLRTAADIADAGLS